ncbi:MAG: hypothetical protein JWN10_2358, partial [Solirubrobacterales bacterium]|nr:hypothetical protein [Solirubrobacterales bacterium]
GFSTDGAVRERYDSLARFYNADERRIRSRELDVGLWWREAIDGPLHRAAWVGDTGELYLVRLGPAADGGGRVEVLASVAERELLERVLAGWREHCGQPQSLTWLRERASLTPLASDDDARARPAEPAPRAQPSRRTVGTAAVCPDRGRVFQAAQRPADRLAGRR